MWRCLSITHNPTSPHLDIWFSVFGFHDDVLLTPTPRRRYLLEENLVVGIGGRISLHVRDLAAIYTGFLSPAEQAIVGSLHRPPDDLALLGALFSGPRPWIADMF